MRVHCASSPPHVWQCGAMVSSGGEWQFRHLPPSAHLAARARWATAATLRHLQSESLSLSPNFALDNLLIVNTHQGAYFGQSEVGAHPEHQPPQRVRLTPAG